MRIIIYVEDKLHTEMYCDILDIREKDMLILSLIQVAQEAIESYLDVEASKKGAN